MTDNTMNDITLENWKEHYHNINGAEYGSQAYEEVEQMIQTLLDLKEEEMKKKYLHKLESYKFGIVREAESEGMEDNKVVTAILMLLDELITKYKG